MKDLVTTTKPDLIPIAMSLTGVSERTRETYGICMSSYQNYCAENDTELNLDSLKAWIISSNKPSTQALRTAAARKVFGQLYKGHPQLEELKEAIAEIKVVKKDHAISESKYVTTAELDQIIAAAPQRIALMIKTLFMTGLRISPALNMKYSDCITIQEGRVIEITVVSKGNKQSKKHITKELFEEIKGVFGGENFLFEHNGQQYNRKYISEQVKKIGKTIGKNISSHSIRHSRAAQLMEKGVTLDKVSKFLDHSQINTTSGFYLKSKPTLEELGVI